MRLYEADYYGWTQKTAELLKRGDFSGIDLPALIDEVEDLGRNEKSTLENRLTVLLAHLLKWDYQSDRRTRSWHLTIRLQRNRIARLLEENPSLRPALDSALRHAYADAILLASEETDLNDSVFPACCPYSNDEILFAKQIAWPCDPPKS